MDPYKVLGVTPQTSDDDVKRAYRELARKYHPDNYVNNPLADLAEARMKEINEAYDTIMSERSGKTAPVRAAPVRAIMVRPTARATAASGPMPVRTPHSMHRCARPSIRATSTWPRACSPVRPAATPSGSS